MADKMYLPERQARALGHESAPRKVQGVGQALVRAWNGRLFHIQKSIKLPANGRLLFPTHAILVDTPHHFVFELIGAAREFRGLRLRIQVDDSPESYLGQFPSSAGDPVFRNEGRAVRLVNLCVSRSSDWQAVEARFPHVAAWPTRLVRDGPDGGPMLRFGADASTYLSQCVLVNRWESIIRVKHVLHATVWARSIKFDEARRELASFLEGPAQTTDDLPGVHYASTGSDESMLVAAQFASVYLGRDPRESAIDQFLREHPAVLHGAFGAMASRFQLRFPWREGNPVAIERFIQPDALLQRRDGDWDICDLKTACLGMNSLTRGGHKRRRFKDYVSEGIAQLANYRDYFSHELNREWATQNLGISVANPRGILLVGNYDNARPEELSEASRALEEGFQVVDYDTVRSLFLASAWKPTGNAR